MADCQYNSTRHPQLPHPGFPRCCDNGTLAPPGRHLQTIQALQVVLEEFLLSKHAAVQPAEAVGLEGAWGLFYVCLLGVLMACLPRQSQVTYKGAQMPVAQATVA